MAQYAPNPLTSIHGRRIGLGPLDEIVLGYRDQVLSGVVFANLIPSSAVSNTTAETAFDQKYTIPANFVRAGSVIKVKFQGIATATNATDTLAINLRLGGLAGTVLLALAARDVNNNDIFYGEAEIIIRSIGATGSFVATGTSPANPNVAGTAVNMSFVGSTALNTTVTNDIVVTATWSAASASDSCRLDFLRVEIA